ncbi:50S ribosomal protein L23 [Ostreibacterium oceani]|uniref:Large ribosomal subunit protein uL23 n=1 Tax=Ostreibacterium oceani TaxID=2654998 RepID=A0A6N7EZ52_9GAMM|nr:50S ribosomal protein L23 [Ostreibacterium oceani]MPV85768.1 50S ribosomal protein L23 [Ostreibacterium oceani]
MNKERIFEIIRAPHVTEKTAATEKQLVFKVDPTATKAEIKAAVKTLFEVDVLSVRVVNRKGKQKSFRGRAGKRVNIKLAYIGLSEAIDYEQIMAD